jgi:cell division protein FtsB
MKLKLVVFALFIHSVVTSGNVNIGNNVQPLVQQDIQVDTQKSEIEKRKLRARNLEIKTRNNALRQGENQHRNKHFMNRI